MPSAMEKLKLASKKNELIVQKMHLEERMVDVMTNSLTDALKTKSSPL